MRFEIVMIETTKAVYEVEADNIEDARESYWEFPCTRSAVGDDHEVEYSVIEEEEPTFADAKLELANIFMTLTGSDEKDEQTFAEFSAQAEGILEDWLEEQRNSEQEANQ